MAPTTRKKKHPGETQTGCLKERMARPIHVIVPWNSSSDTRDEHRPPAAIREQSRVRRDGRPLAWPAALRASPPHRRPPASAAAVGRARGKRDGRDAHELEGMTDVAPTSSKTWRGSRATPPLGPLPRVLPPAAPPREANRRPRRQRSSDPATRSTWFGCALGVWVEVGHPNTPHSINACGNTTRAPPVGAARVARAAHAASARKSHAPCTCHMGARLLVRTAGGPHAHGWRAQCDRSP